MPEAAGRATRFLEHFRIENRQEIQFLSDGIRE